MTSTLFTYPFLIISLVLTLVFGLAWLACPAMRPMIWRSSLLSAPFGLTSVVFVPEYWQPVRVAEFICGPEDIIFSLANGGIVWAAAMWFKRRQKWQWISWGQALKRYLVVVAVCWAVSASLWLLGLAVMPAVLVSVYCLAGYILWQSPQLLVPALRAGLIFGLFYSLILTGGMALWPHFLDQWNLTVRSGIKFGLIPVEELAWAVGFGLTWPLFMTHVFKAGPVEDSSAY